MTYYFMDSILSYFTNMHNVKIDFILTTASYCSLSCACVYVRENTKLLSCVDESCILINNISR